MAASANDLIKKVGASTTTTLAAPGKAMSATSITVGSTTNWPTDTGVTFAIRTVDSDGVLVPGTYTEWKGTVTSGTTIAFNATPEYGSDQVYAAGSTTQVFIPVSSTAHNDLVDALINEHSQLTGAHTDITADSITATTATFNSVTIAGTASAEGWSPLGATPDAVTANGNRSYDLVFNSTDLTDTLSPGMRLKLSRSIAAPTQCADLESSSSHYFNKTSPSGMTFTDDFVVSAWVKLESYVNGTVASRFNGTSGWKFDVNTSGTVRLIGYNAGSGNLSYVESAQSLPLGKWVHIAAQLDMSTFTATTTTSYIMMDGVNVPASVTRAGTNPTALIQAGNLEIGAVNSGTLPFDGKIAQVAIYSAKVTQATIKASMNQTLTGSETSLVSAYSLNNTLNDLSANANNLTAQNSAVATATDTPFAGGSVGTTEYGIVTAAAFSTNTTLTVQVPEGYALPTTGGISAVSYSINKIPYGFPSQKDKWTISYTNTSTQRTFTATTFASLTDSLRVPVGAWDLGWIAALVASPATNPASYRITIVTLSSTTLSSDTVENNELTGNVGCRPGVAATDANVIATVNVGSFVTVSAASDFTLYGRSQAGGPTNNAVVQPAYNPTVIKATLAYL